MASIFAEVIFKRIFVNEDVEIAIQISLEFVPQVMALGRTGDKPLSEPMLYQFTDAFMQHLVEKR